MSHLIASAELADAYLSLALKHNDLGGFLTGSPVFAMCLPDGYGGWSFSAMHVVEALFRKYNEDPQTGFEVQVQKALEDELLRYPKLSSSNRTGEVVLYFLAQEKQGTAPFHLDCGRILDILKKNISENRDWYQNGSKWRDICTVDMKLHEFGYSIL